MIKLPHYDVKPERFTLAADNAKGRYAIALRSI
jgi:hypothetical protein